MKDCGGFHGWRSLVGVLAVGVLAFGLSAGAQAPRLPSKSTSNLDGKQSLGQAKNSAEKLVVPTLADDGSVKVRGMEGRSSVTAPSVAREFAGAPISQLIDKNVRFGRVKDGIPILPPVTVNYLEDEMTIARQQGIELDRRTGLPVGTNAVATTGCSFDIDCDDCNDCTDDVCDIMAGQALGTGTCLHIAVPDGADGDCGDGLCCNGRETCQSGICEAPGAGTGQFDPNGGCQFSICTSPSDRCDEFDGKCKPACTGGGTCSVSGGACTTSLQCDASITGNYCLNCNDGLICNGTETCSTGATGDPPVGVCKRGVNPCGASSALCGEKRCSQNANNPPFCSLDADCTGGGTCTTVATVANPICFPGRCCSIGSEPACTRRAKSITYRVVLTSCNSVGGVWYPGDDGMVGVHSDTSNVCPTGNAAPQATKCPKYGSGIAPTIDFDTEIALLVGPFSRSTTCDHFDIGDDYTFSNAGLPSNNYMAIDHLRWIGAGGGRLVFEFRDALGNLIEDAVTGGVDGTLAVRTLVIDPAIVLPPSGFIVVRPAPQFAPNGRTFFAATDAVDVGSNDAAKLWYDGAIHTGSTFIKECVGGVNDGGWCDPANSGSDCPVPGVCTARNQILAFELEGVKTPEPLGGCCDHTAGTCSPNVEWLCEANGTGHFLGAGSGCNSCSSGTTFGANCSRCSGGANDGQSCQRPADCPSGTCAAGAAVCVNKCAGGTHQGAPCTVATQAVDCPGSTCTLGANPGSTCVPAAACGTGACCNPITGACTLVTKVACDALPGNFQGFGTDCDSDNGRDAALQSCCPQPTMTGADNCGQVIDHPITVPAIGADPVTVTISGNNNPASGPDTCGDGIFDVTAGPGADPGWWESFSINDCAFVRVDWCCSSPTVEPQWSFMYTGCPCSSVVTNSVNPNENTEGAVSRGNPFCKDDDNLWIKYGPIPAGRYYIPIYSVLAGHHGPYQMHVTVQACPDAACCTGANCSLKNILECEAGDGTYLGPPNTQVLNSVCDDTPATGTCGTGSCCTAPGVCKDRNTVNGPKMTEAACDALFGEFKGGIRCHGGTCTNDSLQSCSGDGDCTPGATCFGTDAELAQPSPCPVCVFEDVAHCQKGSAAAAGWRLSDKCVGDCVGHPNYGSYFAVDDFIADPPGGSVDTVCFTGLFRNNGGPISGTDCSGTTPPEKFTVVIYGDQGLPGNVIGTRTGAQVSVIAKARYGTFGALPTYKWSVDIDPPIGPLVGGQTYWISVSNDTTGSSAVDCDWMWVLADQTEGNHYYAAGQDSIWTAADVAPDSDLSFCLNLASTVPSVPTRPCCDCEVFTDPSGTDPHCKNMTAEDCTSRHGDWLFELATCGTHQCQGVGFPGDNCSAAIAATGNAYSNAWSNYCANTDGPVNLTCESASTRFGSDLWYKYTASCTGALTVETCDDSGEIDTVMAVYHINATPNVCPCPPPTDNSSQFGDCNDDGCVFGGAGSKLGPISVIAGECYTIRVAGFQAAQGRGVLHATCTAVGGPNEVTPLVEDDKNRYLGFKVTAANAAAGETAIRVTLTNLMTPNPPNLAQFPPPNFHSFEGQVRWVGAVGDCAETESPPTFFKCAALQCTPHYADFATALGGAPLYVSGREIVPSSSYTVHQLAASCTGNEGTCTAISDPVTFKTQRHGDVTAPYQLPSPNPLTQPAIGDIVAIVDKFRGLATAPITARADLVPAVPDRKVQIPDISACIDAFKAFAYVQPGPVACP